MEPSLAVQLPYESNPNGRRQRVSSEFGETVVYREIDTNSHEAVQGWGLSGGLYVDKRSIDHGPLLGAEQIRKAIGKKVKKLVTAS